MPQSSAGQSTTPPAQALLSPKPAHTEQDSVGPAEVQLTAFHADPLPLLELHARRPKGGRWAEGGRLGQNHPRTSPAQVIPAPPPLGVRGLPPNPPSLPMKVPQQ